LSTGLASGKSALGWAFNTPLIISEDLVNALLGIAALVFISAEIAADTISPGVNGWLCGSLPAGKVSPTWFTVAGQRLFLERTLRHHHVLLSFWRLTVYENPSLENSFFISAFGTLLKHLYVVGAYWFTPSTGPSTELSERESSWKWSGI
jgi:hypothetical protein